MFAVDDTDSWGAHEVEAPGWLETARDSLVTRGDYLAFDDGERVRDRPAPGGLDAAGPQPRRAHPLRRSDRVAAARAHPSRGDAIRVLDDRSLNGVWVNGERVDWRELEDDDELTLGRFRLYLVRIGPRSASERD